MANSNHAEDPARNGAPLDPKILETIGRALKAHYDGLVRAPLPEAFLDLLARLERDDPREKPNASA